MGGKNAIIVMDDADLDLALEGILWSAFGTTGQRCTAASRVIVQRRRRQRSSWSKLVERAQAAAAGRRPGRETDVGPVINQAQLETDRSRTCRSASSEGAQLAVGGGKRAPRAASRSGYFYEPTVFTDVKPATCASPRRRSSAR